MALGSATKFAKWQ